MAAKDKIKKRREYILSYLSSEEDVSFECLQLHLSNHCGIKAGRRTLWTDIRELRKAGNEILISGDRINLIKKTDVIEHSSPGVIRRCRLLLYINDHPGISREGLLKKMTTDRPVCFGDESELYMWLDRQRKNLGNDINELLSQRMINAEGDGFAVSLTVPIKTLKRDSELIEIYNIIRNNWDDAAYSDILMAIISKLTDAMRFKLYETPGTMSEAVLIGAKTKKYSKYKSILENFFSLPYRTKQLDVVFLSRHGKKTETRISVGLLVYLCDRGNFYIIGKNGESNQDIIIEMSRIQSVICINKNNEIFQSPDYNRLYEEMFYVSIEEPMGVKVWFENVFQIRSKIEFLSSNRKYSRIEVSDEGILYYDIVRGMDDFAKFLRKFGKSCIVLEPEELVRRMHRSACKVIERYEDDE